MVKVSIDLASVYKNTNKHNIERAKLSMINQMLSDMQPFIPNDQGILQQTGTIGVDKSSLHWVTPYARAQYYGTNGKAVFSNYTTPGTGPYWDLKAKGLFMSDWMDVFTKGAGF
ncbi:minor capsid protein [Vagococcus fluvialis]|uniref:minor capsid protein n=1 Tax=Vagococcus fluvialis TaxID=2738 RepID=UPI0028928360|nr:minor capsid protein [Vagococcus fluvialis]MDT2781389.1 minor capsid protein [Vagococcus fluvialis]